MTGDPDLGLKNIVALADPTAAQHGATKNYVDTTVIAANNALKANVDTNKVDKDFELQGSYAFILGSKLANGTLVTGDDSSLNNPNAANNAHLFQYRRNTKYFYKNPDSMTQICDITPKVHKAQESWQQHRKEP